jgi:effector-binding domain-containing protein
MSRVILTTALLGVFAVSAGAAAQPAKPAVPKASPAAAAAPAPTPPPAASPTPAAPAIAVKDVEAIHALVVPMKGSYMQHEDAFGRLFGALGTAGVRPAGPPFGRYLNDAARVAEAELLWEIGAPVGPDVKASAPLELRDIPAGQAATLVYDGSPDGIEQAWQKITQWVSTNKYQPSGSPMMMFIGEPGPDGMRIELRLPVTKVQ